MYKSHVFFSFRQQDRGTRHRNTTDIFEETQQKGEIWRAKGNEIGYWGTKLYCGPHFQCGNSMREFYPTCGKWRRGLKRLLNDFCGSYTRTAAAESRKILSNVYLTFGLV